MKIYHNPRCRKSRETLQIIEQSGREVEIIEYLNKPPSFDELKEITQLLGLKPYDLLRRGEEVFKEKFKGKELTDEQWIEAMISYPKLMERPIVVQGKKAILGRPPENVKELL